MLTCRSGTLSASFLALLLAGACSAPPASTGDAAAAAVNKDCVTLAEGALFEHRNGQFLAVSAESLGLRGPAGWQNEIQSSFAGLGFPWMGLKARDKVVTLTGTAPTLEAKSAALSAAEAAIAAHPQAGAEGLLVVDAISVEGGERGVGESLSVLADAGASLESCQRAFTDTMAGRNVTFESGNARISPVSARLLDAVTGVASLCSAFVIEIGGHTDSSGADEFNLQLSQDRADAVRAYLIDKGVAEDGLVSVGFGETRPLDPGMSAEARAANRRTEFKVIER